MSSSEANFFTDGPAKDTETHYDHRKRMRYQSSLSFLLNNMGGDEKENGEENMAQSDDADDAEKDVLEKEKQRLLLLIENSRPKAMVDLELNNVEDVSLTLNEDRAFLDKIRLSCVKAPSAMIGPVMPEVISTPLVDKISRVEPPVQGIHMESETILESETMSKSDKISKVKCRFSLKTPALKKTTVTPYSSHPNNFLKGKK